MSNWQKWLEIINEYCHGSAVISCWGARLGTCGNWNAKSPEEQKIVKLKELSTPGVMVMYNSAKYRVTHVLDGTIIAMFNDKTLVIEGTQTFVLAAQTREGQSFLNLAWRVHLLAERLDSALSGHGY
jgi:hypothetical protein